MATGPTIVDVRREQVGEAVDVLVKAFGGDPLLRYLFGDQGEHFTARVRDFFRFACEVNLQAGWPLLGVVPRSRIAGVACVSTPDFRAWPDALSDMYRELSRAAGKDATARMERYAALSDRHLPNKPLFYVSAIGVRPESHRRGYGRRLLNEVHTRAAAHPTAIGVGLDTENPANVRLYQGLGYEVVATDRLDDLELWCMFRPNDGA
jgi:ribosomal protein S18 acetylase RimI-like enzyme